MRINEVLIKPVVTEKAMDLYNREGKYTFEVDLWASKKDVKKAMKEVFDVEIEDVKIIVLPGKKRRVTKTSLFTTTQMKKKAIFKLKKGKLDIYQG